FFVLFAISVFGFYLLRLFFVLFAISVFGVFLSAFLVISQPFDVNGFGIATFFFSDQPLTALVPSFTACRFYVAELTTLRAELLGLEQILRAGFGRKRRSRHSCDDDDCD